MKLIRSFVLLAMTLLISACSNNITVETKYSKATNFNDFKYYSWHQYSFESEPKSTEDKSNIDPASKTDETKPAKQIDKLLDQNIRFMIDQQLAQQGMIKKEQGQADFLVHYSVAANGKVDAEQQEVFDTYSRNFQSYRGGYGYSGGYYSGGGVGIGVEVGITADSYTKEEMMLDRYREGVMKLDFHEPDTKEIIWSAIGEKRLPEAQLPNDSRDKLIQEMISEILSKFPPK